MKVKTLKISSGIYVSKYVFQTEQEATDFAILFELIKWSKKEVIL